MSISLDMTFSYHSIIYLSFFFFFFKQNTAYEWRISDWSSDVCSSDLVSSVDGGVPLWSGQHGLHRATDGLGDPLLLFSTQQLQLGQHSSSVCARLGLLVGVLVAVMSTSIARDLVSAPAAIDRQSVVWGKSVSVRVDTGGRRCIQ